MTGLTVSIVVFVAFVAVVLIRERRRRADERLAEIARAGMTRDRFPHAYVGPDTSYGLLCGSACRVVDHLAGNVVRVVTTDGRAWNVAGHRVKRRTGHDVEPAQIPKRRRAA